MKSLKSILPALAKTLGTTPAALYERQRALVRAGLIDIIPGRGAGSGVRATPHALAMLLISLVATGSLSEVETETKAFASLKSSVGRCPLTGKKTFGAALTAVLSSDDLAERTGSIQTVRGGPKRAADILYRHRAREHYYTAYDLEALEAKGEKPDRDKLHIPSASLFGDKDARHAGVINVATTLFINWAYPTLENK